MANVYIAEPSYDPTDEIIARIDAARRYEALALADSLIDWEDDFDMTVPAQAPLFAEVMLIDDEIPF